MEYVKLGESNSATAATIVTNTNANGVALRGIAPSGATANGVLGTSPSGVGVLGATTTGTGVRGQSPNGIAGVFGVGGRVGVHGKSESNYGVRGEGGYAGVLGTGGSYGVYGTGTSAGVVATTTAGYGGYFQGPVGSLGIGSGTGYGAWGYNSASGGYGAVGQGGYRGVYGSGGNAGVYGTSGYVGVWANATGSSGLNYGIYATTSSSGGFAGVFVGRVMVSGTLSKTAGSFTIDHPLDPERKWLQHSFVESPDMMNVYNGNVTTDAGGYATIELPAYFGALNRDFRYQLTVIGKMAQAIVDREISKNQFRIRTSEGHVKVSWQVTGIRQDAYAKEHPIKVEVLKSPTERGTRSFLPEGTFGRRMQIGPRAPLAEPSGAPRLVK